MQILMGMQGWRTHKSLAKQAFAFLHHKRSAQILLAHICRDFQVVDLYLSACGLSSA